jgi:acetyl esterase/lipase
MRTAARYLAPALVALGAILTIANWYVNPARGRAWAITLAFIVFLVVPIWLARRVDSVRQGAAASIRNGVCFAGLMLIVGLGGKLAQALGAIDDEDLSRRLTWLPCSSSPGSCSGCGGCDAERPDKRVNGETMYAALTKAGVPASFIRIDGAGHGFSGADLDRAVPRWCNGSSSILGARRSRTLLSCYRLTLG